MSTAETTLAAADVRIARDKTQNLRRFAELIEQAAAQDVDILVLPEDGLQGYADLALRPGTVRVAALAHRHAAVFDQSHRRAGVVPASAPRLPHAKLARPA